MQNAWFASGAAALFFSPVLAMVMSRRVWLLWLCGGLALLLIGEFR